MGYKDIINVIPTIESAALVSDNLDYFGKKKKKRKSLTTLAVRNIIGTSLIGAQANLGASLP